MIGFEPTEPIKELDEDASDLKSEWMTKWHIQGFKNKEESVVNYLASINTSRAVSVPTIVNIFEKHIGSVDGISDEKYNHLHKHFQGFTDMFLSRRREQDNKRGFKLFPDVKN